MDAELIELMVHTITVEPPAGTYSDRGQPAFGAAVSYACYIDPVKGEEIVRTSSGEERRATYRIYVNATSAISPEGRLTLPSGYDPQQPPMLASALRSDENGAHHVELMV